MNQDNPIIVPPIKINLKIKNRCKDGFNHRYQYTNPFGDNFEQPPGCLIHKDRIKYQCELVKAEDVLNFRSLIYKSTEKSHQNDFIRNYLEVSLPKRRYGKSEVARVMTVVYKVPNLSGSTHFKVCRSMFFAVTGMFEKRVKGIAEKLFKKFLMEQGNVVQGIFDAGKKRDPCEKREKMRELLSDKTERILSLEKGTFDVFSRTITNSTENENPVLKMETKSNRFKNQEKRKIENDFIEGNFEEQPSSIDSFEICRICLNHDSKLKHLFKGDIAEMFKFCFSIQELQTDILPQKLCHACLSQLKEAYKLKMLYMESQEIMKNCLKEVKEPQICFEKDSALWDESDGIINLNEEKLLPQDPIFNSNSSQVTKCYLCNTDFTETSETAIMHFKKNHSKIEMRKCEKCEFVTEYSWFMNLHYQVHEDDKGLCVFCGKVFKKGSSHLPNCKTGKNSNRQRLFCRFCNSGYWKAQNLKEHERTHTQERPYNCEECSSSFFRRIHLRKHIMLDHGVEPPFRCSFCLKRFLVKNRMLSHEITCSRKSKFTY